MTELISPVINKISWVYDVARLSGFEISAGTSTWSGLTKRDNVTSCVVEVLVKPYLVFAQGLYRHDGTQPDMYISRWVVKSE